MTLPEGGRPLIPSDPVRTRTSKGGFEPGPLPPFDELMQRLAIVLERRATRPALPGYGRWEEQRSRVVERAPADPVEAAAASRRRVEAMSAAERTLAQQQEVVRKTEQKLIRQLMTLEAAERRATDPTAGQPMAERIKVWASSGRALAEARMRLGISQRMLAREAHHSRSYVCDMELDVPRGARTKGTLAAGRLRLATILAGHLRPQLGEGASA